MDTGLSDAFVETELEYDAFLGLLDFAVWGEEEGVVAAAAVVGIVAELRRISWQMAESTNMVP